MTRQVGRVGVFRPIVRSDERPDYVHELLLHHQGVDMAYDLAVGVTYDRVNTDPDDAMSMIVDRYHAAATDCEAVIIVSSDYTGSAARLSSRTTPAWPRTWTRPSCWSCTAAVYRRPTSAW